MSEFSGHWVYFAMSSILKWFLGGESLPCDGGGISWDR